MKIRPLYDRVVVSRLEEEQVSAGGILIPDSAKEKPSRGKVLAIGSGRVLDNGDVRALAVKVNDTVLFGKYAGTEIKHDGKEIVVLREEDILGVIEG